jgi:hypothetical protein
VRRATSARPGGVREIAEQRLKTKVHRDGPRVREQRLGRCQSPRKLLLTPVLVPRYTGKSSWTAAQELLPRHRELCPPGAKIALMPLATLDTRGPYQNL